jgi:RNA polymerase sporulation-specific sigma factor
MRDTAYQALKVKEEMMKSSDKEPDITDIAMRLDLPVNEVAIALDAISEPMSMSEPIYSDGEDTIYLSDQVSDSFDSENKWIENINLKESLEKLDDREREILLLRYYIGKTQMEVSEEVGISQAQVSRLEKTAIDSIKKNVV